MQCKGSEVPTDMDDDERRNALIGFAREGQRTQAPVFVGREEVIKDISQAAEIAYAKWSSGGIDARDPGLTRLVQGAPGAGKTALLRHLQDRWRDGPRSGCPIAVRVSASALKSPADMRKQLREQIPKSVMEKWGEVLIGGLAKIIPGRGADVLEPAARVATGALREKTMAAIPAAVVVMVDESQRVVPHSTAAIALQNLHDGSFGDILLLPVFAGLGYLYSHLQQEGIGISRYSHPRRSVHTLGPLEDGECRALLKGWLNRFEVAQASAEFNQWSEAFVRDTEGWPMHTNGFLVALASELARPDNPNSGNLISADLQTVRRAATEDRVEYYDGRYEGAAQREVRWVGRAMAALDLAGGEHLQKDATDIIHGEGSPEGDADEIFSAFIERGFLQRKGSGLTFACPIPSLTSHAAIAGTEHWKANSAAALGNVNELSHRLAEGGDIEGKDALGRTPLRIASECRWADVVRTLIEAGAEVDARDLKGTTARDAWPEFDWPHQSLDDEGQG